MNVSLQDEHNIGWKLAHIIRGKLRADAIGTYVSERSKVAAVQPNRCKKRCRPTGVDSNYNIELLLLLAGHQNDIEIYRDIPAFYLPIHT
jgi:hypothetical protein